MEEFDKKPDLTVLHDWDRSGVYGRRALLQKMVSSFCILVASYVPVLLRLKFFHEPYEAYRAEKRRHLDTLLKLDTLTGVTPIFGIRDVVISEYPELANYPHLRIHRHIGEPPDQNRVRTWEPPLNQPPYSWHYDTDYVNGKKVLLKNHDIFPVWHVDHVHYLSDYIGFLYKVLVEGEQIYV